MNVVASQTAPDEDRANLLSDPNARPLAAGRKVNAALTFSKAREKTYLAHQITPHPFHITRPFYFEEQPTGMATLYLQSSAGGLYGDDDLELKIAVNQGGAAHVTSQASTVVHAARGGITQQRTELTVASDAWLEYLPDPLILFTGARARTSLKATVGDNSILCMADSFLCHDPMGSGRSFDDFENTITIQRSKDAPPILIDRANLSGTTWPAQGPQFSTKLPCYGGFYIVGASEMDGLQEALRTALKDVCSELPQGQERLFAGVDALEGRQVVAARLLCADGAMLTAALAASANAARAVLTGLAPPRRPK